MKKRTNKSLNKLAQNLSPSVFEEAAEKLFYGTGGYCCVVIKFYLIPAIVLPRVILIFLPHFSNQSEARMMGDGGGSQV